MEHCICMMCSEKDRSTDRIITKPFNRRDELSFWLPIEHICASIISDKKMYVEETLTID